MFWAVNTPQAFEFLTISLGAHRALACKDLAITVPSGDTLYYVLIY